MGLVDMVRTLKNELSSTARCRYHPNRRPLFGYKLIIEKARKRTRHELLRNTPGSPGAKLSIVAAAMRAKGTDIWAHCCTAAQHGNQLGSALTYTPLDVPTCVGSASVARRRCMVYLGRRRKRTTPWPSADSAYGHGSLKNRCSAFMLLPTKKIIRSMSKTNQA